MILFLALINAIAAYVVKNKRADSVWHKVSDELLTGANVAHDEIVSDAKAKLESGEKLPRAIVRAARERALQYATGAAKGAAKKILKGMTPEHAGGILRMVFAKIKNREPG